MDDYGQEPAAGAEQLGAILRETPEVDPARTALINKQTAAIKRRKKKLEPAFKTMREDMKFVAGYQVAGKRPSDRTLALNITQKHVNARVAALYAKNPTFTVSRRKRLDFKYWDGQQQSLEQAAMAMQQAMATRMPPPPEVLALIQDVQTGVARRKMLDNIGRTVEAVFSQSLDEQSPNFKKQLKQFVRRALTCGVAYIAPGYQRELAKRPDSAAKLPDITDRVATAERLQDDVVTGESGPESADAEQVRHVEGALQAEQDIVVREGLVFDFPSPLRIIPDEKTRQLAGWIGAEWVAEEILMSCDEIKEIYQKDVGKKYTGYTCTSDGELKTDESEDARACVWKLWNRKDGVVYTICDGYPDYLEEPGPPDVYVEQFFPWFTLAFNEVESEEDLFPQSDVRLLRPIQLELNRIVNALRQHRIANRPIYVAQSGKFESKDLKNLASAGDHDIINLVGLDASEKIENVIQELKRTAIDPNLYEHQSLLGLLQFVVGWQDNALAGKSGDSATESSIAEGAKLNSTSSNADDLDDCLSAVARAAGQILLREMTLQKAQEIAGPGAVWPEMTKEQIAEEIYLEVEAGSSGRPNKAQDMANFERIAPILIQIPGMNPDFLARYAVKTLDARIDLEEAVTANLPAITSINSMMSKGPTGPDGGAPAGPPTSNDPNAQGAQGGDNAERPPEAPPGAQPAYPAPGEQPSVKA